MALAEYADTNVFVPELDEWGTMVPAHWFGQDDSAEEIASSDEGEDEEGEDDVPEDGVDGQPQPDRASSKEPRAIAADADQEETHQSATPPAGAAASTNLPDPPAAPLA